MELIRRYVSEIRIPIIDLVLTINFDLQAHQFLCESSILSNASLELTTLLCVYSDINRHPVGSCDIHRIIDNKFASSSFVKHVSALTFVTFLFYLLFIRLTMKPARPHYLARVSHTLLLITLD